MATLCWDCANATGGCQWSQEQKPIRGWVAKKTKESYIVCRCPEFVRHTYGGGQYKDAESYITALEKRVERMELKNKTAI